MDILQLIFAVALTNSAAVATNLPPRAQTGDVARAVVYDFLPQQSLLALKGNVEREGMSWKVPHGIPDKRGEIRVPAPGMGLVYPRRSGEVWVEPEPYP